MGSLSAGAVHSCHPSLERSIIFPSLTVRMACASSDFASGSFLFCMGCGGDGSILFFCCMHDEQSSEVLFPKRFRTPPQSLQNCIYCFIFRLMKDCIIVSQVTQVLPFSFSFRSTVLNYLGFRGSLSLSHRRRRIELHFLINGRALLKY